MNNKLRKQALGAKAAHLKDSMSKLRRELADEQRELDLITEEQEQIAKEEKNDY